MRHRSHSWANSTRGTRNRRLKSFPSRELGSHVPGRCRKRHHTLSYGSERGPQVHRCLPQHSVRRTLRRRALRRFFLMRRRSASSDTAAARASSIVGVARAEREIHHDSSAMKPPREI